MKTAPKKSKRVFPGPHAENRLVRLDYLNPGAKSVYVAGSFNAWHPNVTEMFQIEFGHWAKELALAPGTYEYRLIVDGRWMPDPGSRAFAPNPYGERNSILIVPPGHREGRVERNRRFETKGRGNGVCVHVPATAEIRPLERLASKARTPKECAS